MMAYLRRGSRQPAMRTMAAVLLLLPALLRAQPAGKPPMYSAVPDTSFSCSDHMAGYYADMETGCQAYHMCDTLGKQYSYLCPNMTVFNQRFMVCDHWHYVNCSSSDLYYDRNARMAGGGKKTHMPGRRSSTFLDNISANDIDTVNARKVTQAPITHKEIVMNKIINQLLSQDRKATSVGITTKDKPTTQLRTRNQSITTTARQTPTNFPTSPLTTARQPTHSPGGTSTTRTRATRTSTQRPSTTVSSPQHGTQKSGEHQFTTNSLNFTPSRILSSVTPAPGKFSRPVARNATSSVISRHSSTKAPRVLSTRTPLVISPFARTSTHPFKFPGTQVQNFSQLNNATENKSSRPVQMLPGMVARGSGPRFGFGLTNLVRPHEGHLDVSRDPENHPLVLEISRQLLLQKLGLPQSFRQVDDEQTDNLDPSHKRRKDTAKNNSTNSQDASPFLFTVVNPPNGRGLVSFPIEPAILEQNTQHFHLGDHGGQQEYITLLEAKKNGRNRTFPEKFQWSSLYYNQAFFIPEIPPDETLLDQRENGLPTSTSNEIEETFSGPDGAAAHGEDHHHHHHMTMIFPTANSVNFTQTFGGLVANPNCPECHPAFLTPGKCTPCVRIR